MKLQKEISEWFKWPDDPDKAEFKFKILNPGEVAQVQEAAFDLTVEFKDGGEMVRQGRPNQVKGREREVALSLIDWRNVFDESGDELEFNDRNRLKPLRMCPEFYEFFSDCQKKLLKIKKAQEKNS